MPAEGYEYRVGYIYEMRWPKYSDHQSREGAQDELDSIDMEGEHIVRAWIERRPAPERWREMPSTVRSREAVNA